MTNNASGEVSQLLQNGLAMPYSQHVQALVAESTSPVELVEVPGDSSEEDTSSDAYRVAEIRPMNEQNEQSAASASSGQGQTSSEDGYQTAALESQPAYKATEYHSSLPPYQSNLENSSC